MAPAEVLKKDFAKEVIRCFRLESPLVDALNTPLVTPRLRKAAVAVWLRTDKIRKNVGKTGQKRNNSRFCH